MSVKSPLERLPPEIQGHIADYLPRKKDLNNLCRSCKQFKSVALPRVYKQIVLKATVGSACLRSLEKFLGTPNDAVLFTTTIQIEILRQPADLAGRIPLEDEGDQGDRSTPIETCFGLPSQAISDSLNTFVRLLVLKLPKNRLTTFLWNHTCAIHPDTVDLLLEGQSESLVNVCFYRYSLLEGFLTPPSFPVSQLHLPCIDSYYDGNWPICLLAKSLGSLTDLALGFESLVARDYARNNIWCNERLSNQRFPLSETIAYEFDDARIPEDCIVHLNHLALTGLDLLSLTSGDLRMVVDLCSLETLVLQSCIALGETFELLTIADSGSRDARGIVGAFKNLQQLRIRFESSSKQFRRQLGTFLASVPPLVSLQVLLEGYPKAYDLNAVLKCHGETLRSLVWDERIKKRTKVDEITNVMYDPRVRTLRVIEKHCPGLVSLGISIYWQYFISSWREDFVSAINNLKNLKTLNIRNLPATLSPRFPATVENTSKSLAEIITDAIVKDPECTRKLRTIALGALTYSDLYSTDTSPMSDLRDFLQLRFYRVDYHDVFPVGLSAMVTLVGKGTKDSVDGICEPLDIFDIHWLG